LIVDNQSASLNNHLYDGDESDDNERNSMIHSRRGYHDQLKSRAREQFDDLDEYLARQIDDESVLNTFNSKSMTKRDTLWTTTEVLDCVRRLKLYKDSSKLDLVTEMLNCYRRLKHVG
jgi:hypothetical protein